MATLPLRKTASMSSDEAEQFLAAAKIPLRLSFMGGDGHPLVASHWFAYRDGQLFCAVHSSSLVARRVMVEPRVGFEVAGDTPPYKGVRGAATAELLSEGAEAALNQFLLQYLGEEGPSSALGRWLLSRGEDERLLCLNPVWLTAWDYTQRMP